MRVSIITPTLNRAHFLEEAIASVLAQEQPDIEHLILDGGSTDGTMEMLARHPHLRVVSEPDRGLYDAINKGLRLASGEVVGWLNSDDRLPAGALSAVLAAFADPAVEAVSGTAEFFGKDGDAATVARIPADVESRALNVRNLTLGTPAINARFFRRSFRERVGEFDLRYRIAADREWLLRAALLAPREAVIDTLVYQYREHDDSLTLDRAGLNASRSRQEHLAIAEEFLGRSDLDPAARATLRAWHTSESSSEAHAAALRLDLRALIATARRGWSVDAGWPLACLRTGLRGLAERAGFGQPS